VTTSVGGAAVELADGSGDGDRRGGWPCSSGGGGPKQHAEGRGQQGNQARPPGFAPHHA